MREIETIILGVILWESNVRVKPSTLIKFNQMKQASKISFLLANEMKSKFAIKPS